MIAVLTASLLFLASGPPDEVTVEHVQEAYSQVFSVERRQYGQDIAVSVGVEELPPDHFLSGLVNDYSHFPLYLVQNGTGFDVFKLPGLKSDSATLAQNFHTALRKDEKFNKLFLPVVARYLENHGAELVGYEMSPPREVSFARIMEVAIRFFYPSAIRDGRIVTHVCVGISGVKDLEGGRNLLIEAFAYTAIFRDLLDSKHDVRADFNKATKLLNEMNLSSDEETRLARAQGVMWSEMQRSEALKEVLLDGYEAMENFLPFEIKYDS